MECDDNIFKSIYSYRGRIKGRIDKIDTMKRRYKSLCCNDLYNRHRIDKILTIIVSLYTVTIYAIDKKGRRWEFNA